MKRAYLLVVFLSVLLSACNGNLSFDNIEFNTNSTIATPIIYFDLTQNNFYDVPTATEVLHVTDTTRYTFLTESIVQDNLDELNLFFEVSNQFERSFEFEIEFLDETNVRTHQFQAFLVNANTTGFTINRSVNRFQNPDFLNTSKFVLHVRLQPGTVAIDPNQARVLNFKSSGLLSLSF